MMTTAGSLALLGSIAARDRSVAQRLRAAGAVILGKTNLSEWANFRSSHSTSGWSGRGGLTRNPYALDRNPCGSSSGSGAAVAANLCALAIGTETDGSIVCPASMNGLVGIKPTLGLISRARHHPHRAQPGYRRPMARTVTDAALLLTALAGIDAHDAVTRESAGKAQPDYTQVSRPERPARRAYRRRTQVLRLQRKGRRPDGKALDTMKHRAPRSSTRPKSRPRANSTSRKTKCCSTSSKPI